MKWLRRLDLAIGTWLARKFKLTLVALGVGGGAMHSHTLLIARKKELSEEGKNILASGVCTLQELARTRPELWDFTEEERREVRDKVVTDDFVEDIVDALVAETWTPLYKYHHSGTGTNAEAASDAALQTPVENARDVGTHVEDSSKVYKSVATTTYTGTHAIVEHGLFKTAGAGGPPVVGGILADRTKISVINVVNTNQIEWTFKMTFTSGG